MLWLNVCLGLYAFIMLGGGVMGYRMAGSTQSLIAGVASSVLLAVALFLSRTNRQAAYGLAAVVVLVLIGFFIKRSLETDMAPRNLALAGGSVLMLVLLAVGNFTGRSGQ